MRHDSSGDCARHVGHADKQGKYTTGKHVPATSWVPSHIADAGVYIVIQHGEEDVCPCMLALQISLVEMPSFSFNINVYGGDITFLPGVEKWINWFIETRVLRPYVLPERLTVPVRFLYDPTLEVNTVLSVTC